MTTITRILELPYETPPLTANQRLHFRVEARIIAGVRRDGALLARSALLPKGIDYAKITLHWQPSTVRKRDRGNLAPTVKALVDGIVGDYGFTPDDTAQHISTPEPVIHPVAKPPRLWLELEWSDR